MKVAGLASADVLEVTVGNEKVAVINVEGKTAFAAFYADNMPKDDMMIHKVQQTKPMYSPRQGRLKIHLQSIYAFTNHLQNHLQFIYKSIYNHLQTIYNHLQLIYHLQPFTIHLQIIYKNHLQPFTRPPLSWAII